MPKFFIVIAILITAAVFLLSRHGKAEAVSECIEKAGATATASNSIPTPVGRVPSSLLSAVPGLFLLFFEV